jgi:hypothetical protein
MMAVVTSRIKLQREVVSESPEKPDSLGTTPVAANA